MCSFSLQTCAGDTVEPQGAPQAGGESDTHFTNDPGSRRDTQRGMQGSGGGVGSEEVDFEGLSCARLLTPEMTVVVPASQDSSVCGKRHGPT